ncbi:unnamed protein product [Enterobius vermicularis]|uniref:Piwi domain-containing protein n=1 Tax=Enterobius vermicularis TaxID=51028 RepID=A0A158QAL0_ENTVE|nr:unnamed protein product [Enterobius vermicularis]
MSFNFSGSDGLENQLERLKLVELPAKVSSGIRKESVAAVITNVWLLEINETYPIYRYDVQIFELYPGKKGTVEPRAKEITRNTREDYLIVDRRNKCLLVLKKLFEQNRDFFGNKSCLVYDRASILFSCLKLQIPKSGVCTFTRAKDMFSSDCIGVEVNIKPCVETFQLTSTDIKSTVSTCPENVNRNVQQFYELMLSQEAFFADNDFVCYDSNHCFLMKPEDFGFNEADIPILPEGKYCGVGSSKSIKTIRGAKQQRLMLSIVVDLKKGAFHIDNQPLVDKVSELFRRKTKSKLTKPEIELVNKMLKGCLRSCFKAVLQKFISFEELFGYLRHQEIYSKIVMFSNEPRLYRFSSREGLISVADYFKKVYGESLKYPDLALVVEKTSKGLNYYPMEMLEICENQRVAFLQQSALQVQNMIKACAVVPYRRHDQIKKLMRALKIDQGGRKNRWCQEFRVKVAEDCLNVMSKLVAWRPQEYKELFTAKCKQRGMGVQEPIFEDFINNADVTCVRKVFEKAKANGAAFIHFVTSDKLLFHARETAAVYKIFEISFFKRIFYLEQIKVFEALFQIITQNLKTSNAIQIRRRPQTLDNIVHKTNLKFGGLNYVMQMESKEAQNWIDRDDRIIISFDFAPTLLPRKSEVKELPSVLGFSANCGSHPQNYIGWYRYVKSNRDEVVFLTLVMLYSILDKNEKGLSEFIAEALRMTKKNRTEPKHIMILRDGVSEGQYKYVINTELEHVRKGCALYGGPNYKPKITFLVVTKNHNMRIFPKCFKGRSKFKDNIPPGTVIDEGIVNPVLTEFYLNPHIALQITQPLLLTSYLLFELQGSTNTPRYNLLYDTAKLTLDEMEGISFALALNLQITTGATALPAPVVIADAMAARGRNNFSGFYMEKKGNIANYTLEKFNAELGITGRPLAEIRFAA